MEKTIREGHEGSDPVGTRNVSQRSEGKMPNAYSNITTSFVHKASAFTAITSAHAAGGIDHGSGGFPWWTTTLWVASGVIVAALITRAIKISEFRQAWINELRNDIAEYISKSDEWVDIYLNYNFDDSQEHKAVLAKKLDKVKYDCFRVLRRIELRFKPDDDEGNLFLSNLRDLLDPQKMASPEGNTEGRLKCKWDSMADAVVFQARHILKKEWEVTKNPLSGRS